MRVGRGVRRRPDRRGDLPQPDYFFASSSFSLSTCHLMAKYIPVPSTRNLNVNKIKGIQSIIFEYFQAIT